MKLLGQLILLTVSVPALLPATDFKEMVQEFSRQTGVEQLHIPFFGLARFVVAVAHPKGTSELQMAVFEHVDGRQTDFGRVADDIASGSGWKRVVRVREKTGQFTHVYMVPDGKKVRLLIAIVDPDDAVFVEMKVNSKEFAKFVDEHSGKHKVIAAQQESSPLPAEAMVGTH